MVKALDLKSGDPAGFVRGSPLFNSSAVLLLPVGILNLLSSFQLLVSLALKAQAGSGQLRI